MTTVLHRLAKWAKEDPAAPAQSYKQQGVWKTFTAKEYCDRVYYMALFLESRGIKAGDISCIFGPNSYQWSHVDLGVLLLGGMSAGIYPNSISKDITHILRHTEAKVLSVHSKDYFNRACQDEVGKGIVEGIPLLLSFDAEGAFSPKAITYNRAIEEGRALAQKPGAKTMQQYLDAIDIHAGAFIVYTSGTTGNPKGALVSHDNLTYTSDRVNEAWHLPYGRGEKLFSFLPLCHIAEKLHSVGVGITQRFHVYYATRFDYVSVELPEVQPTLLLSVPRLWEKMMEGVNTKIKNAPPAKKKMVLWAFDTGKRVADAKFSGRMPNPLDLVQYKLAEKLVFSKVKQALGLAEAKVTASGAAALPPHVSRWFRRMGFEILDCLGQTETTGMICLTEPGVDSAGTVGRPLPGSEMKLAEDGEILCRGRQIFKGYLKDDTATAQTLEGGWLHTGDLGELNDHGLLMVRGRKKEIMKTSGGKMIAPLPIEEEIKTAPFISQVCMVGDGKKFPAALVTLSETELTELKARGVDLSQQIISDKEINSRVREHVVKINKTLPSYEQIKKIAILSQEFSIEEGEMTPTMKMKRNVIEKKYKNLIDSLYAGRSDE